MSTVLYDQERRAESDRVGVRRARRLLESGGHGALEQVSAGVEEEGDPAQDLVLGDVTVGVQVGAARDDVDALDFPDGL